MTLKNTTIKFLTLAISLFLVGCQSTSSNENASVSEEISSNSEHLKNLEWLIGSWRDRDDDIDVLTTFKWDKNKKFIIENFVAKSADESELEGMQIIGWDPVENKIRAWIFDSDGGFGEGNWVQQDDTWYENISFKLPSGQIASTTLIYKKIDDRSYQFSSESRDVDGELLPDIDPVTVIRE